MTPRVPRGGTSRAGTRRAKLGVWLGAASLLGMLALFVGVVIVSYQLLHSDRVEEAPSGIESVQIVGPEETVFSWGRQRCFVDDIPDLPARAFRDEAGRVHLIAANAMNTQLVGPALDRLSHPCTRTMPSDLEADPAQYNDAEWLAAPYTEDGRTVYALVHNEYHGHEHPGRCPSGEYINCWYNAITLAVSRDGGASFQDARPPPQHLVASVPRRYVPDAGPYGIFSPSNIVRNEDDGYYYALVVAQSYREQQRGSCLLRTKQLGVPSSWRAWDGSGFGIAMTSAYQPGPDASSNRTCTPVSTPQIAAMHDSLTYNTYLDKYLLVGSAGDRLSSRGKVAWGIYYSVSDDLVKWSRRRLIREVELPSTFECGDRNPILYPSLIDPDSTSRSFETTGRRPYMYFTRYHYTDCRQTPNRDLIRVQVDFTK